MFFDLEAMPWSSTSLLGASIFYHFGSFLQQPFKATTFPLDICIQLGVGRALGILYGPEPEVQLCLHNGNPFDFPWDREVTDSGSAQGLKSAKLPRSW